MAKIVVGSVRSAAICAALAMLASVSFIDISLAQRGPVTIEARSVAVARVVEEATAVGTLLSAESADISPEIAGRIEVIAFDEGMPVNEGELLFQLDSSVYEAQRAEAQSNYELKQRNFDRADGLLKNKVGTVRARDEALSEMQVARALLTMAEVRLEKTKILAPFDGIVGLRNVSRGDYVQPGAKLVNLEKIDPIKVDFSIAERYLADVRTGANVRLTVDALGDREFTGTVYAINPQIDPAGRSIALRAQVPNPDGLLRPGLFARVGLQTAVRDNAIITSEDAIVSQGGGNFVYRVVDDKAVLTPVTLGQRRYGTVEILDGLSEGDVVVVAGQIKLRDGAEVDVKMLDEPAEAPAPATAPSAS
ncbi:efflux RND transporter periplasmic adaptor subunit [Microbaculum marinisediminis]|uniref:Efflux RND transporter periplasmic adaptor subunit n=1 Tax=Microbaculum marinisediminis TaxID=2931392 RepID=A0AAW5QWX4_9HYPH|nr:efflux RND transporter periplasmic adaptor subunit [Microbaculum sp. A6E488]MCT8970966.1 efflux RND transporter periplasmic adaptor subunit [Microbaculum sp. A6E488]